MKKKISINITITITAIIILMVGFLTYVGIKVATVNTELNLVKTFALPELPDLDSVASASADQWAIAVDGLPVVCGSSLEKVSCNIVEARPTASTAKMILALAVMEKRPFNLGEQGEIIAITPEFYNRYLWYINNGGSNTAVVINEEISEYAALASVMLPSSNNMADTLAIWAFGSLENYRVYTTEMLARMGIENTTVGIDASGFDPSTVSTAADLAKIGAKLLENPVLREIAGLKEYTVPVAGVVKNTNSILGRNGIIGIKTGWIGAESGYCLVTGYLENGYLLETNQTDAAQMAGNGHIITIALLGAKTRPQSMEESNSLVESLQAILKPSVLVEKGQEVGYYESWWTGRIPVMAQEEIVDLAWKPRESYLNSNNYLWNQADDFTADSGYSWSQTTDFTELTEENLVISLESGKKFSTTYTDVEVEKTPNFWQKLAHVLFGWSKE